MKVIVSHDGKQHVNALLTALNQKGLLVHFFTAIDTSKFWFVRFLSQKWQQFFKKRGIQNIDKQQITHFPLLEVVTQFYQSSEYKCLFTSYRWFDKLVAKRLPNHDFDLVIGHENSNLLTFKEAKRLGKTTVLDFSAIHHEAQKNWLAQLGTYQNTEELDTICAHKAAAFAYTDYILTLSKFSEQTLIDAGFPKNRIFKTYLGVNHTVFTPKKRYNTEGGHLELKIKNSELKVGDSPQSSIPNPQTPLEVYYVGIMTKRKGLPFIKTVHDSLLAKGLNIRLTLIGPADDFETPQQETPQYRHIPFLYHADLVKMHHDLDLFVFPSYLDSWGQAVVEAMACGSPALVSENTGAKDVVEIGGGQVLPLDDHAAWAQAIEHFYHHRADLERVGKQAAAAAQQFSWEAYNQQVIEALRRIAYGVLRIA